jgi:hypothetical protein
MSTGDFANSVGDFIMEASSVSQLSRLAVASPEMKGCKSDTALYRFWEVPGRTVSGLPCRNHRVAGRGD